MKNQFFKDPLRASLLLLTASIFGLTGYFWETGLPPTVMLALGLLSGLIVFGVLNLLTPLVFYVFSFIPIAYIYSGIAFFGAAWFAKAMGFRLPDSIYYTGIAILFAGSLMFVYSLNLLNSGFSSRALTGLLLPMLICLAGIYWFAYEGSDPWPEKSMQPKLTRDFSDPTISLENPAKPGPYPVSNFTYGSGKDKKRVEYSQGVRFVSPEVDASLILPDWKGKKKKWRERFWGFGATNFPLNGRVYFPEGEGPFPLVLMVHGNHSMIDYSDDGYGYLGELLASQGMIAVSVDENFLNSHWSGDFRGKEMPARAWVLLKHLELWHQWNADPAHPLSGKMDPERIMLVGHSRGGEAVAIAAVFNDLPAFPDNALLPFDFNFGIRSVVAIAPTDYRYERKMYMKNLNYLSIQGSYDADETSFWGMRAFRRLAFTDGKDHVKAGVYIHRANHGQFNTTWGRKDFGPPYGWLLNTAPLLSAEDQQQFAEVFIGAFAKVTLSEEDSYRKVFSFSGIANTWLPPTPYLTHFQTSEDQIIQDYEEDLLVNGGKDGLTITASGFTIWKEEILKTRNVESQENNALILGWDYGQDLPAQDSLANYSWHFKENLFSSSEDILLIDLASGDRSLLKGKTNEDLSTPDPLLQLTDSSGLKASLRLSDVRPLTPPLKSRFLKHKVLSEERVGKDWEVHLENYALPLQWFQFPAEFNPRSIRSFELIFDNHPSGVLVVDNLGVRSKRKQLNQ